MLRLPRKQFKCARKSVGVMATCYLQKEALTYPRGVKSMIIKGRKAVFFNPKARSTKLGDRAWHWHSSTLAWLTVSFRVKFYYKYWHWCTEAAFDASLNTFNLAQEKPNLTNITVMATHLKVASRMTSLFPSPWYASVGCSRQRIYYIVCVLLEAGGAWSSSPKAVWKGSTASDAKS